jgi:hypothetical protein
MRLPPSWSLALLSFGVVLAARFGPVLAGRSTVVHGDAVSVSLPLQKVLAAGLAEGRIPLWSDEIYGGHPLFAEGQGAFAHPLNLLLFGLLPAVVSPEEVAPGLVAPATIYAHGLFHVLCGLIAALGTYALCRSYGQKPAASLLAGFALACSQDWLWQTSNSAIAGSTAFAPWALFAIQRWWLQPDLGRAVGVAVATSLVVLGGYPQAAHGVAIFAAVCIAAKIDRAWFASPWAHITTGALALALTLGLSAIQLLPTFELIGESVRSEGVGVVSSATPSMQLRGALYSIGKRAAIDPGMGSVLVVALAGFALRATRPVLGLLIASALLFQLSAAEHSLVYRLLHHTLPGLDGFRITHLYATLGAIGLAVLAGFGVERLSEAASLREIPRAVALWCAAVAVGIGTACVMLHDDLVPTLTYVFPAVAVVLVVGFLAVRRSAWVPLALTALVVVEILVLRMPLHDFASVSIVREPPPIVREITRRSPEHRDFRLANVPRFFSYIGFASASTPGLDRLAGLFLSSMDATSNLLWSIPSVNANLALPLERRLAVERLIEAEVRGETPRVPGERFIDGFGVRYAVVHNQHRDRPFADDLTESYFDPDYRFYLLENLYAEPRIRFVPSTDARPVVDAHAAAVALHGGRDGLLFVEAEEGSFPNDTRDSRARVGPAAVFASAFSSAERYEAKLDVRVKGFLVVADAMYPGWKAWVDGAPRAILAANALEKAILLAPGKHHVVVEFQSATFRAGRWITCASIVVCVGLLLLPLRRRVAFGRHAGQRG